jgi:Phosphoesterase family
MTDPVLGEGLSKSTPIQRVVVIVRENRTLDNYLGRCPIPGADLDPTLPNAVPRFPDAMKPTHGSWSFAARDFSAIREQYAESQVPFIWEWAREYGVHDRFFSETGSPSTPGHLWLITGNDGGILNNPYAGLVGTAVKYIRRADQPGIPDQPVPPFAFPTLPGLLTKRGITWKNYGGSFFQNFAETRNSPNTVPAWQFFYDAMNGTLPAVSWLYSPTFDLNEHAPDNVTAGTQYTASALGAIELGCRDHNIPWESFLCVNIYDDSGGYWDHVTPPNVENYPLNPEIAWRHGFRIVMQTISAWSKAGPNHTMMSHCSLPRAIMDLIGEEPFQDRPNGHALGYRDGHDPDGTDTNSLLSGLDFGQDRKGFPITTESRLLRTLGRKFVTPGGLIVPESGLSHAELNRAVPEPDATDLAKMRARATHYAEMRPTKGPSLNG